VAVVPDGSVRRVAVGRRRVRALLRLHRRREQPVGSGAVQRHHAGRTAGDARGGLPPDRGPGRSGRELGASTEGADARQAVLRVLRAGRDLQRLWLIEATKYNVLPLDDRTAERVVPEMAGRPTLIHGNSQLFLPGMGRLSENSVVSIKNKVVLHHRRARCPRRWRRGRDRRPGRPIRGVERLHQGRQGEVRVQRARHPGVRHRGQGAGPGRHPPGADGVRLRRRRAGQKEATSPSTTTGHRWAPAVSKPPSR
jgi:hypothetical protein